MINRCAWCGNDPQYIVYHDNNWGVPIHDDRMLFEMLTLEGAQAGLSWLTILKKRENYFKAFDGFNAELIAKYTGTDQERLMNDARIIRNRLKILSTIGNARCVLQIQQEFGSFDSYLWGFVDYKPRQNFWGSLSELPARTLESDVMSKDMKKRGFKFVGSTICYALMQSIGMVNDHLTSCFRYDEVKNLT